MSHVYCMKVGLDMLESLSRHFNLGLEYVIADT